jgi:ribosomal-protein-alanine N-acetyltransferase
MESKNILIRKSTFADCALFSEWETQKYIIEYLAIDTGHCYENIVKEFVR